MRLITDNICRYLNWFRNKSGLALERTFLILKAKCLGVAIGRSVKCWGRVHLVRSAGSRIEIGKNVSIICTSRPGRWFTG